MYKKIDVYIFKINNKYYFKLQLYDLWEVESEERIRQIKYKRKMLFFFYKKRSNKHVFVYTYIYDETYILCKKKRIMS